MKRNKILANRANYGGKRSKDAVKYLVFHYTANDGDNAENNGNYFKNNVVKASAHLFVDDDSVVESVPLEYVAYAVGGKKWNDCSKTGGGKLYGKVTNTNSISIELCDTLRNKKIEPTEKTLVNAISLAREIMKEYNIDLDHVVRHFDVTGKHCPAYYMNEAAWKAFKNRIGKYAPEAEKPVSGVPMASYKVKVTASALNIRAGAGTNFPVVGTIRDKGVYTIIEKDGVWGRLKSKVGWIHLGYTKKI